MPQFTFTNNTYAGEPLAGFMASTLLGGDSVERGLLTVLTDVKSRKILLDVDDDVVFQNPSAIFNDQGTTATQNESYLDPIVFEFMKQEDFSKLIQSWESRSIEAGSFHDYEATVDLADFLEERYKEKIQIALDSMYWVGKSAVSEAAGLTAAFPGLLNQAAADGGTYKVSLSNIAGCTMAVSALAANGQLTVASTAKLQSGDVVTLSNVTGNIADNVWGAVAGQSYFILVLDATTIKLVRNYNSMNKRTAAAFTGTGTAATISFINVSNVIPVLGAIYAQLDPADRIQSDFKVQIPLHVSYAYKTAQANAALNVLNAFTDDKKLDYLGLPLEVMNHWKANTIMGARKSNLFLGVDLMSDQSNFSTVYMMPFTNDNVVRIKARMKAATQIKFFNEVFYLSA